MIWKVIAIVFWVLVGLIGFCKCIDGDESKTLLILLLEYKLLII